MEDSFFSITQVSGFLKIPKSTIYKLSQEGKIPCTKIGKQLRFRKSSLEKWLNDSEGKPKIDGLISGRGSSSKNPQAKTVLLIDDDTIVLRSLSKFLEHHGYNLEVAESGEEALENIKKRNFDLIITDIRMPGLNGIETIKRIREFNHKNKRPVAGEVIITGYADPEAERQAERLGITDFIYKPFATKQFLEAIESKLKEAGASLN
ncbi:MAG: response regulator [Candidatus Omnitrophota bacterium]